MNRREAIKTLGAAGLSLTAASIVPLPTDAEPTPQAHQPAIDPSLPPPPGASPKHDMRGYGIPAERQQIAMLVYPDMTALELLSVA